MITKDFVPLLLSSPLTKNIGITYTQILHEDKIFSTINPGQNEWSIKYAQKCSEI